MLDLVDGPELVGRLHVRKRVLELPLPRGVRAEGEAGRGRAGGVEPDQLCRDLLDRLARATLGLLPVGAAEPVQRRRLAADVLRHLVELVGGHEEAVARLPAAGRRVLDQEVLPSRTLHRALDHLDVAADTMLLVHDVVTGAQLQRVDGVAPPARHPPLALGGRAGLTEQVGLGQQGDAVPVAHKAAFQTGTGHVYDAGLGRRVDARVDAGGDVLASQHLDEAFGRTVSLGDQHDAPAVADPALDVADRLRGVAAVAVDRTRVDNARRSHAAEAVDVVALAGVPASDAVGQIEAPRRERPPRHPRRRGAGPKVGEAAVGGSAEVERSRRTRGGICPGRLEELLAGREQVMRARSHSLRITHHEMGAGRHLVEQQDHLVDENRCQRLHALDRDAFGELGEDVGETGPGDGQLGGPRTHLIGEQQLAAGRCPHALAGDLEASLVGDLEVAHLLDRVTPQLEAQRMLLRRWEHVDDAPTHREVTAFLDEVDPVVRGCGKPGEQDVEVDLVTGPHGDGFEVTESGDHRLQQAAHRSHDDAHGAAAPLVVGMRQSAEHVEPSADRVAARAQPLVRQGLPGREPGHRVGRQQVAQRDHQALRLALGRGDGEHRAAGPVRCRRR